jgi:UTP--glucose-1-phosphate uridylyltransferase
MSIAVVPVAGLGTRLLPLTKTQPKEMLPVGRRPVVHHIVEELIENGVDQILFITGASKASIENYFDLDESLVNMLRENGKEDILAELQLDYATVKYYFTRQRQLLGLGHAIQCASDFIADQSFSVALGDTIIQGGDAQLLSRMQACFDENDCAAVIAFETVPQNEVFRYGIAHPKSDGDIFQLSDIVEKPSIDNAPSQLAVAARYIFKPVIFDALKRITPGAGGELQLTDAIRLLIAEGHPVYGVRLAEDERRFDIGNYSSYYRAFIEFALADETHGEDLREFLSDLLKGQS